MKSGDKIKFWIPYSPDRGKWRQTHCSLGDDGSLLNCNSRFESRKILFLWNDACQIQWFGFSFLSLRLLTTWWTFPTDSRTHNGSEAIRSHNSFFYSFNFLYQKSNSYESLHLPTHWIRTTTTTRRTRPSLGQQLRKGVNFVEFCCIHLNLRFSRNAWPTDRQTDPRTDGRSHVNLQSRD